MVKYCDTAGPRVLAEAHGEPFAYGAVVYDGNEFVPFGDRPRAEPLSCLGGYA